MSFRGKKRKEEKGKEEKTKSPEMGKPSQNPQGEFTRIYKRVRPRARKKKTDKLAMIHGCVSSLASSITFLDGQACMHFGPFKPSSGPLHACAAK